jgi:hypothetical protein
VALLRAEVRGHGAVDPTAQTDEDAVGLGLGNEGAAAGHVREGSVQGVGGELGGMKLSRRQTTELVRDAGRRDPGGVENRLPPYQGDAGAAGRDGRSATLGIEGDARERSLVHAHRNSHDVATCGPTRTSHERAVRDRAPPMRLSQMALKGMHPGKSR